MDNFEQIKGLSLTEVAERRAQGEYNRFSVRPTRSYAQIIRANVFSLYNLVLLISVGILLALRGLNNALAPAFPVIMNIILGLVQEVRAKRALDKLATLTVRTVSIRRDGKSIVVPIGEIVRGDVVELHPGDSAVIDGFVLASDSLEIDESLLTGESEYVPKQTGDRLLSGSFCVAGVGLVQAENIGNKSYVNNLANVARAYKSIRTPLEKDLDSVFRILMAFMVVLGPLTFVAGIVRGTFLGVSVENVVNLIASLVPQGLILSVAVSFAYGTLKITRFNTLIQRINAIESMGHVVYICTDKTGTLTKNVLSVKEIIPTIEESMQTVQDKLILFVSNISWKNRTVAAIDAFLLGSHHHLSKVAEVPFSSERKWSSVTLTSGETLILGAPEILVANSSLQDEALRLSEQGLRVLAFAISRHKFDSNRKLLPPTWDCIALIGLQDEIRSDVGNTLEEFAKQGIEIKILSGDNPETVKTIAYQAGIRENSLLTGPELEKMDDALLSTILKKTSLFARIKPDTKQRIIAILSKQGSVAMIGDGINDVPALKQADVAIAMNDGAQIAKDVSDIILLDNAFSTLPQAIAEGREITQRVYAIAKIFLVKVVYLTILFVLASFVGFPWPANLLQTTWLGTMTTAIPTVLIAFRLLPTVKNKDVPRNVIQYSLIGGIIGGITLTIIDVLILIVLKGSLALSQTMIIVYACLYGFLVFWDVNEITLFSLKSFFENIPAALSGIILCIASVLIPLYLIPSLLNFVSLGRLEWFLLVILLGISYFALKYFVFKPSIR